MTMIALPLLSLLVQLSSCRSFILNPSIISASSSLPHHPAKRYRTLKQERTTLFATDGGNTYRGMQSFKKGDITGSIEYFDMAEKLDPSVRPFLWQRGISYYYADRFLEGSKQFRYDVKVNPLDVEEIVWDIACLSRLDSSITAPIKMMSLPPGKSDPRKIMRTVYSLFRGELSELDLVNAGHDSSQSNEFYSLFYLGLYCESKGESGKAESYMKAAASSRYANGSGAGDYMTSCAIVHCRLRGWTA